MDADFKTVARFSLCGQVFELFNILNLCSCSILNILLHKRVAHFVIYWLTCYLSTSDFLQ